MRQRLDDIVKKASIFIRAYGEELFNISATILLVSYLSTAIYNKRVTYEKAKIDVELAKAQDRKCVVTYEGTYFSKKFVEKTGKGRILVEKEEELIEIYNPSKAYNRYGGIILSMFFMRFLLGFYNRKKGHTNITLNKKEKTRKGLLQIGAIIGASPIYLGIYNVFKFNMFVASSLVVASQIYLLCDGEYVSHLNRKRYLSGSNLDDEAMLREHIIKLEKEGLKALKKGNSDEALRKSYEISEIYKKLSPEESIFPYVPLDCLLGYNPFFNLIAAIATPNDDNLTRLMLSSGHRGESVFKLFLDHIVKYSNKPSLEFRLIHFERSDEKDRIEKFLDLYHKSVEIGEVEKPNIVSANEVGLMRCGALGLKYVSKIGEQKDLEEEIKQTKADTIRMSHVENAVVGEIILEIEYGKSKDGPDSGQKMIVSRYKEGKTISQAVNDEPHLNEKIRLLRKAIIINDLTLESSIGIHEEDRFEKAKQDIESNDVLTERQKEKLVKNWDVLFKYAPFFDSVRDVDLQPNNILVNEEGYVFLDRSARNYSDPAYQVIKLVEHDMPFERNDIGLSCRFAVFLEHFRQLGYENTFETRQLIKVHCLASGPLKSLSYYKYSQGKKGTEETRRRYMQSAEFYIKSLLKHFGGFYESSERIMLSRLYPVFRELQ